MAAKKRRRQAKARSPKRRKPSRRTAADKRRLAEDVVDRCRGRRLSQIPGGKAAGVRLSKFPRKALVEGVIVELEHTSDPVVALEIASDHLAEDQDYYPKLATIHKENPGGACCSSCSLGLQCESACPKIRQANVRQHAPLGQPALERPVRDATETQLRGELRDMLRRGGLPTRATVKFWSRKEESGASARDHAYVYTTGKNGDGPSEFHFSRRVLHLDRPHREAILAHEVGHVLAEKHWGDSSEDGADQAARELLGVQICYDPDWPGKGLQVRCATRRKKGRKANMARSNPPRRYVVVPVAARKDDDDYVAFVLSGYPLRRDDAMRQVAHAVNVDDWINQTDTRVFRAKHEAERYAAQAAPQVQFLD